MPSLWHPAHPAGRLTIPMDVGWCPKVKELSVHLDPSVDFGREHVNLRDYAIHLVPGRHEDGGDELEEGE